jgi:hypothetical protein
VSVKKRAIYHQWTEYSCSLRARFVGCSWHQFCDEHYITCYITCSVRLVCTGPFEMENMRIRFADSETTADRQTVFPLLCVGQWCWFTRRNYFKITSNCVDEKFGNFPQCFTANISFVLLPIFVLLFNLIKSRFSIYILFTLFRIQSLSPSLFS